MKAKIVLVYIHTVNFAMAIIIVELFHLKPLPTVHTLENILCEDPDSEGSNIAHIGTRLDGGDQEGSEGQDHCGQQATS